MEILDNVYAEWTLDRIKRKSKMRDNGCIEWIGAKTQFGYGQIQITLEHRVYRTMTAHRAHWMAHYKVIPPKYTQVCHKCDNPPCVNLEHLFLGTAKDNCDDKVAKGRYAKKIKPHSRVKKFSNEIIEKIKMETGKNKDIAQKYGISPSYISQIRSGNAKKLIKPDGWVMYYRGYPMPEEAGGES